MEAGMSGAGGRAHLRVVVATRATHPRRPAAAQSSPIRDFFADHGLVVVDQRSSSGNKSMTLLCVW
jgi:hypothetical protein